MSPSFDDIPRPGIWKKLLLGAFLVVFATASATAVAAFREVDKVVEALRPGKNDLKLGSDIAKTDPGEPQTIMLLGSDRRPKNAKDGGAGAGARSDTIILARLDPDKKATALMSLPRDLKVQIPGHGTDKINAAYELGGPRLTLKTVKLLTGLSINHVINVDFRGFQKAIDAIGCIYADIDRTYFNDSPGYAYIDVKAGYQKLCGEEALEYARFRHEDSDLVRGVRQQDLLREAKQQVGVSKLVDDRDKLIEIFGKYTTSDAELKTRTGILRLLKLAVFSRRPADPRGALRGPDLGRGGRPQLRDRQQRDGQAPHAPVPRAWRRPRGRAGSWCPRAAPGASGPGASAATAAWRRRPSPGKDQALQAIKAGAGGQLPVYYPTVRTKGSDFASAAALLPHRDPGRQAPQELPDGHAARGHRRVLRAAGHHLEGAAHPREPVRGAQDRQAHLRAPLRRRPPAPGGLAHQARRLLDLQHAAPDAHRAPDAGHRPLDAAAVGGMLARPATV